MLLLIVLENTTLSFEDLQGQHYSAAQCGLRSVWL